jgi:hypothetical protein
MELDGVVQNGVIVPQGNCPLPNGTKVRIHADAAPAAAEPTIWDKLRDLGKKAKLRDTNLPADLAENHDHYLHGRPKRT